MQPYGTLQSFIVDPQRDGVDNALWKHTIGNPVVSGGKFRFNTSESVVRADIIQGRIEFSVTPPLTAAQTPTDLVDDIEFGLRNLSLGSKSKIVLLADKTADEFLFQTHNRYGAKTETAINWEAARWNGKVTVFIFEWFADRVRLSVLEDGQTEPRVLANHSHKVGIDRHPLNPFIKVTGDDNFDVDYIVVDKTRITSIMII